MDFNLASVVDRNIFPAVCHMMSLTVSYGYSGTNNNHLIHRLLFFQVAGVAELVDAADSKSAFREEVWVRVPPPVPLL